MDRGTTPLSLCPLRICPWPLVKRISIDYVRKIFPKRSLPLEKEYRLVWSQRQLGQQLDSPSCRSEFSDSVENGVFNQSVYIRGIGSSSLCLSVLWLPQHKPQCLLLFLSNTMPSYSHSSFPDLATNFWEVTVRIFTCNVVQEMFSAVRNILVYHKVPSICFSVLLVRVHISLP